MNILEPNETKFLGRSRYKEEPNRNIRTEDYSNQNKLSAWAQ